MNREGQNKNGLVGNGIHWVTGHPYLVLIGIIALLVSVCVGAKHLTFSNDIRVFFSEENPQLKAYNAIEETYSKSINVLFVVHRKDGGSLFNRGTLEALQLLTEQAWEMPYSRRVDSLTNYQHSYAEEDDLMVEDLVPVEAIDLTDEELAHLEETALADPLLVNRLVSPDGTVAGINVPISLPGKEPLLEQPEVANFARSLAERVEEQYPDLEIMLTGIIMINQELSEAAERDFTSLIPIMFLYIAVSLGILLRSVVAPLTALAVIFVANALAFGAAGWIGIGLSPPVVSAVNMIMTMAIADAVHILTSFREQFVSGGRPEKAAAMIHSLKINFKPVFLTSLTTMLGFLSLNTSDSPPFRDLGNIVAIGVFFAWLLVYTLLPALMMLLPVKARPIKQKQSDSKGGIDSLLDRVADVVTGRPAMMVLVGGMTTIVIGSFVMRNELNDEFVKYFDANTDFRKATDFTIEKLTGFEYLEYEVPSEGPGGIAEPDYLAKLDAFAGWFRQQPKVRHVYAHSDMIKRLHKNLFGDDPDKYSIPESRAIATDCLTLYEMSLPFGLDLNDRINLDKSATLMRVSVGNITSNELLDLDARARQWQSENGLDQSGEINGKGTTGGTGQSLMFAHIGLRNIYGLLGGTVAALVLISLCMIAITRSFKFGLASLAPNLAPALIGFGIWGLSVGQVGLAISVVVGMTLGVVVDDSIHFLMKYLDFRRQQGCSPVEAIRRTIHHVGRAMITSTVTLVGGFAVLAFSTFELNRGMGILSAIVIGVALVFDLFILPPLLLLIDRSRQNEKLEAPNPGT